MSQEILVNVNAREIRIAILQQNILQEIHIERHIQKGLVGHIYKGRVNRLLPGIQAAFIDIGLDRMGFLHLRDWDLDGTAPNASLQVGQTLLVQVYKDHLGSKGARLTTHLTIPSRYLVLTPNRYEISVSQRLTDPAERERLQKILSPSDQGGYIFRTLAAGVSVEELQQDKKELDELGAILKQQMLAAKVGDCVYQDIPMVLRILRDSVGYTVSAIRVDDQETVTCMREYAKRYVPALTDRILFYADGMIFDEYGVEEEIQKALQRKVYLKSGGYLVFDQTEAMTTIDVNTGSAVSHMQAEQTVLKTNKEAAWMIARQLRLRNLGGIILIDFIDMEDTAHQTALRDVLVEALSQDSARSELGEFSSLGLLSMTRKRTRESIEHVLCRPCPVCQQRGSVKSLETMSYEIFRAIQRMAGQYHWSGFLVRASAAVVANIEQHDADLLAGLVMKLGKKIRLQAEVGYLQEQYEISCLPDGEKTGTHAGTHTGT